MAETIRAAMTVDGWRRWLALSEEQRKDRHWYAASELEFDIEPTDGHATAAALLYSQPFGFTWEDVDLLREVGESNVLGWAALARDLADRIAALLPPRDNPNA